MNLHSFFRTTTFRLAAFHLALFTLSVAIVLGVVYWFTAGFINRHTEETVLREVQELSTALNERGRIGLLRLISERSADQRSDMIYAIATPAGEIVAGNLANWPIATSQPGWIEFDIKNRTEPKAKRAAVAIILPVRDLGWLLVGHDMTDRYLLRGQILLGMIWAVSLALVIGTVGALYMSRRVAERIEKINRTIDSITAGSFADRLEATGSGDEIDRLVMKLNRMLDEIGRLMLGMRQVTDNVAHDLRTPLSRLRARLELAQLDPNLTDPQAATLEQAIGEIDRLLGVFNAILTIAAAETGRARADFEPVDLSALVAEVAELYEPLAEERGLTLELHNQDPVHVRGSRQLLAQLASNLVENAVKYSSPGGHVRVAAGHDAGTGRPLLSVADEGPGIPADQRDKVLERFVRLEAHRGTPGHGLGLSLAAAVARLHDAELRLDDHRPGMDQPGLRVSLLFPA
ncbi:sensor histidine kinase [Niveispirillum irakense]|uniref:sensor histidine kinase n=1 Tax=Niveispirillum irakense TaxID=34011 RepID=UPI000404836E|nr:HAMP domain-containing sensor histidine kinase [Niveispirillum irakense]